MIIGFYKEFGELGYLATYSNHGFWVNKKYYKTSEHYYQSQKFTDIKIINKIIKCKTPKEASNIGRDRTNKLRKNWKLIKCDVMYDAVMYKFLSHPILAKKLIATGNAEIVEETVKENYWGCGIKKDGRNNYGKILCMVREKLKEDSMRYYTKEGFERLKREYEQTEDEINDTTKLMGKSDEMDSDLRENPEFMELRVKAMYGIPNKRRALAEELSRNIVIIEDSDEYKNWDMNTVIRKCKVSVSIDGEPTEEYTILGHNEGNIHENILSCEAPLVLSMLGHKIGESVEFNGMKIDILNVGKVAEKEQGKQFVKSNEKNN